MAATGAICCAINRSLPTNAIGQRWMGMNWTRLLRNVPQFADKCDWTKLNGWNWVSLLSVQPQLADKYDWKKLDEWDWVSLLSVQPQLADKCDWEKLDGGDWVTLLRKCPQFADKCDWAKLSLYDWIHSLPEQFPFLRYCDGRRFPCDERWSLLSSEFLRNTQSCNFPHAERLRKWHKIAIPEVFQTGEVTPGKFMIVYNISRQEAADYFKKQLAGENWIFIRRLFEAVSPVEIKLLSDKIMLFTFLLLAPYDLAVRTIKLLLQKSPDLIRDAIDGQGCSAMTYFFLRQTGINPLLLAEPDKESKQLYRLLIQNGADPEKTMGENMFSYPIYVEIIKSHIKNRKREQQERLKKHGGK